MDAGVPMELRQLAPGAAAVVELRVDEEEATLVVHREGGGMPAVGWPLGWERVARGVFRSGYPSALAVEEAIATIEDAVMPVAARVPPGSVLAASGSGWQGFDVPAGRRRGATLQLGIEDVERLFDDWVAGIHRAASRPPPAVQAQRFAAQLLLVRELMHHLRIDAFLVIDLSPGGPPG